MAQPTAAWCGQSFGKLSRSVELKRARSHPSSPQELANEISEYCQTEGDVSRDTREGWRNQHSSFEHCKAKGGLTNVSGEITEIKSKDRAYIKVNCMGQAHSCLVDTGASQCLISTELYKQLPRKPPIIESDLTSFIVANSEPLGCFGKVELPMLIGTQYVHVMFYVVPRLLHDIIIGRDCLAIYNAKIDYGRDIVQMEISEGLYSMNSVTIAPMTSQLVMVKMRDSRMMSAQE